MKKLLILLLVLLPLVFSSAVYAQGTYRAEITVIDTSGTARTGVPALVPMGITEMVNQGFLSSTGLDARVFEGVQEPKYMVASDRLGIFIPDLLAFQSRLYKFETGHDSPPNESFGVIVGTDGYITTPDHADLELGNTFWIELKGWINTSSFSETYPVVRGRSSGATTAADVTSHAITLPGGIQIGELLLVVFSVDGNPTCTDESGLWTKLGQTSYSTTVTGAIFYKVAAGSDSLTVTTSASEQSSHVAFRISGAGAPTATAATGIDADSNPPNHNPGVSTTYLWIATRSGDSNVVATVAPTNYNNLQTKAAAGTGGASTNTAERLKTASSEDPGKFTSAAEEWVSYTVSIPSSKRSLIYNQNAFRLYIQDTGKIRAAILTTGDVEVKSCTTTTIDSGYSTIRVTGISTGAMKIYLLVGSEWVQKATVDLEGTGVPTIASTWYFNQGNAIPYLEYLKIGKAQPTTEILRPNAAGSETTLIPIPAEGPNWDCVNDVTPDEGVTDVNTNSTTYLRDLYNLPAPTGYGTINSIKIYFRCLSVGAAGRVKPSLRSDTTVTDGTEVVAPAEGFTTFSEQWNTNPANGKAWEWADIDALQIGVSLKSVAGSYFICSCTQVYVEIDYIPTALWYQPVTIISGTTLPDRMETAQNGTITWGGVRADSGSTTTLVDSELTQADDYWNGKTLRITKTTDGLAPQGESSIITDFVAADDELEFDELTAVVDAGDYYQIWSGNTNYWGSNSELTVIVGGLKSISEYSSTPIEEGEPPIVIPAPGEIPGYFEAGVGTATFTSGSANVVGIGTNWSESLEGHSVILITDGVPYEVLTVVDSTHLTLTGNYGGTTGTGGYLVAPTALPWYDLFNRAAVPLGWSTTTLYGVMAIFGGIGIGVGVVIATGSALLAVIAVGVGLSVGAGAGVIGWWVVLAYGLIGGALLIVYRSI